MNLPLAPARRPHPLANFFLSICIRVPGVRAAEDHHGGCRKDDAGAGPEPAADRLARTGVRVGLCHISDARRHFWAASRERGAPSSSSGSRRFSRPSRRRLLPNFAQRTGSVRGAARRAAAARLLARGASSRYRRGFSRPGFRPSRWSFVQGLQTMGLQARRGAHAAAHCVSHGGIGMAARLALGEPPGARFDRAVGLVRAQHAARASVGVGSRNSSRSAISRRSIPRSASGSCCGCSAIAMSCCCSSPTCA